MNDKFFDTTIDTLLPDFIANGPFFDETLFSEIPPAPVTSSDMLAFNSKMDNLIIASNTQALQIEVELVKRRKLRSSVRLIKQNLLSPCKSWTLLLQFGVLIVQLSCITHSSVATRPYELPRSWGCTE